jgi:hypothetical protein
MKKTGQALLADGGPIKEKSLRAKLRTAIDQQSNLMGALDRFIRWIYSFCLHWEDSKLKRGIPRQKPGIENKKPQKKP